MAVSNNFASLLWELVCHMGSHSVTCHPTEVTFPSLPPAKAGTRFSAPKWMQGSVDLYYQTCTLQIVMCSELVTALTPCRLQFLGRLGLADCSLTDGRL